jgi:hypothetical protein
MRLPKWLVVTRNEYRILTSSIREIRPYFPFLVIGILVIYVVVIAPAIVGQIFDDFVALLLSRAAVSLVRYLLFMFFFLFITFPISYTLRDINIEQQQIYLSAPVAPSHILLGEFLGELPLYAIIITIITGFFTALLRPMGLNILQIGIIVIIFVVTLSSALWIGTVVSALLRTRLGKTARGRDLGKALSMIIVLPVLAFMYAILGGGLADTLADPGTGGIAGVMLGLLPSSWGADIITNFASSPGDITAVLWETLPRLGGLIIFFAASLWVGTRIADRAYTLETTTFTGAKTKQDGALYRALKQTGSSGALFVTIFKVYTRRLQNLSYIAYIVGLLVLMNIFLLDPGEYMAALEMGPFMFPMLAAFVSADITLRGKETLFIYRKTPSGEGRFIKAMLYKGWAVAIPVTSAIVVALILMSPEPSFVSLVTEIGFITLIVAADVAFASGLFLLMPAYTERGGEFMVNVMIVAMTSLGLFFVSLSVLDEFRALPFLHCIVGVVFLYLGKRNLRRIE